MIRTSGRVLPLSARWQLILSQSWPAHNRSHPFLRDGTAQVRLLAQRRILGHELGCDKYQQFILVVGHRGIAEQPADKRDVTQ